ncbi:Ben and cat operon transcriptional regulator [Helicobacter pametensis]|nr:Ben and cat operon transcriptional regulator [Helicobacter pametensis]
MDIKRLKYFCTVVECGSFTKAAEMLHISQPPLSKRVQELEQEIGTPLLFRDGGRIRPTPTGFSLYERALEILVGIGNDDALFAHDYSLSGWCGMRLGFQVASTAWPYKAE